jgi:hypothetical protein
VSIIFKKRRIFKDFYLLKVKNPRKVSVSEHLTFLRSMLRIPTTVISLEAKTKIRFWQMQNLQIFGIAQVILQLAACFATIILLRCHEY